MTNPPTRPGGEGLKAVELKGVPTEALPIALERRLSGGGSKKVADTSCKSALEEGAYFRPPAVTVNPGTLNPHIPITFNTPFPADGPITTAASSRTGQSSLSTPAVATRRMSQSTPLSESFDTSSSPPEFYSKDPYKKLVTQCTSEKEESRGIPTEFYDEQPYKIKSGSKQVKAHSMPKDYEPNESDVLCGRGRSCKVWKGNQEFRKFLASKVDEYSAASTKSDKGYILSETLDYVRFKDPPGHFLKKDKDSDAWYDVGDFQAREKSSQYFRDALAEQYRSATRNKYAKRIEARHGKPVVRKAKQVDVGLYLEPGDASVARIHASMKVREASIMAAGSAAQIQKPQASPGITWKPSLNGVAGDIETKEPRQLLEDEDVASVLQFMASTKSSAPASREGEENIYVCALQLNMRQPGESPVVAAQHAVDRMSYVASKSKVDLFVLPELSPLGYSEDTFSRFMPDTPQNQQLLQNIDDIFSYQARRLQSFICYGTIGWREKNEGYDFFIRQLVLDRNGQRVACYDKIHLCDYGDCRETRFFVPGPRNPVSFSIKGMCFGILICADIRYAEMARKLAREHKVDALLQPSAFSRDISFRSWRSFQETRAIENSVYFFAVNYAGTQYGETRIVRPWVDAKSEPKALNTGEGFLVGEMSRGEINSVRREFPYHRHLMSDSWASLAFHLQESKQMSHTHRYRIKPFLFFLWLVERSLTVS